MIRAALLLALLAACNEHGSSPGGGNPDARGPGPAPGDSSGLICDDDSAFEPNDAMDTAFVTNVDTSRNQISFTGLSLCTTTDVDFFEVTLSATSDLEAVVQFRQGALPNVAILNPAGTPLVVGTRSETDGARHAFAAQVPAGTFFVRVAGSGDPDNAHEANYDLSLTVTPR